MLIHPSVYALASSSASSIPPSYQQRLSPSASILIPLPRHIPFHRTTLSESPLTSFSDDMDSIELPALLHEYSNLIHHAIFAEREKHSLSSGRERATYTGGNGYLSAHHELSNNHVVYLHSPGYCRGLDYLHGFFARLWLGQVDRAAHRLPDAARYWRCWSLLHDQRRYATELVMFVP